MPFPGDVPRCLTGPGTGGDAKGFEGRSGRAERARARWWRKNGAVGRARGKGLRGPRRRAILTLDAFERGPEAVAAARGRPNERAVLHLGRGRAASRRRRGVRGGEEEKTQRDKTDARDENQTEARRSRSLLMKLVGEAETPSRRTCGAARKRDTAYVV